MRLVDMHSSWLVINSIVGCTNACKYCILQDKNNNLCSPKVLGTPEQAVNELINFKYYDKVLPLCLFPNTDIFLNRDNIDYLLRTLDILDEKKVTNDLILITKCLIPEDVLMRLKSIQEKGINIVVYLVVYLSYSGLDKDIEPNVNHEDIKRNFEILSKLGIPIVHYYRPFIEQNSNPKDINETLNYVHKYTPVSAIMGLMYVPTMISKDVMWEYLKEIYERDLKRAVSIWTESAWNYFYKDYDNEQDIFQTNTCALNSILHRPSTQYYGTYECENFNHCSEEQRKLCESCANRRNEVDIINSLNILFNKLGIQEDYTYEFDKHNGLKISNINLDVKTLSYLSYILGIKVYVTNGQALNDTYNSTLNGAMPLVLRRKA